jgi:hypothetical protein
MASLLEPVMINVDADQEERVVLVAPVQRVLLRAAFKALSSSGQIQCKASFVPRSVDDHISH